MPIYEFLCQSCGNEFERIQSFSDSSVPSCPRCAGEQVVRRLGRPAIHFKGSGWYITDSKNGSKQSAVGEGENGKAAASEKGAAGEKSADKPAEKNGEKSAAPAASASASSASSSASPSASSSASSSASAE